MKQSARQPGPYDAFGCTISKSIEKIGRAIAGKTCQATTRPTIDPIGLLPNWRIIAPRPHAGVLGLLRADGAQ